LLWSNFFEYFKFFICFFFFLRYWSSVVFSFFEMDKETPYFTIEECFDGISVYEEWET